MLPLAIEKRLAASFSESLWSFGGIPVRNLISVRDDYGNEGPTTHHP